MTDKHPDSASDAEKPTILQTVFHYAKIVWEVPAVQSAALTWLIRIGVPSAAAAVIIPVVDALAK